MHSALRGEHKLFSYAESPHPMHIVAALISNQTLLNIHYLMIQFRYFKQTLPKASP